jgi:hypothetical protein
MQSRSKFSAALVGAAFLACSVTACGDPPQRVDRFTPTAMAVPTGAPYFAGELDLKGELAAATDGAVFVAVRSVAEGVTLLVRKYDLRGPGFGEPEGGLRKLRFELGPENAMMAGGPPQFPAALQLWVFFDADGSVDTKEDRVSSERPVELGDQQVRLSLPEG